MSQIFFQNKSFFEKNKYLIKLHIGSTLLTFFWFGVLTRLDSLIIMWKKNVENYFGQTLAKVHVSVVIKILAYSNKKSLRVLLFLPKILGQKKQYYLKYFFFYKVYFHKSLTKTFLRGFYEVLRKKCTSFFFLQLFRIISRTV